MGGKKLDLHHEDQREVKLLGKQRSWEKTLLMAAGEAWMMGHGRRHKEGNNEGERERHVPEKENLERNNTKEEI